MTTVLQRLVFPLDGNPDVLPLYVDSATWGELGRRPLRLSDYAGSEFEHSRFSATLPAHKRYSFGTYFNAFPAAYWQRWTTVTEVTLTLETDGSGRAIVYKSNSQGDCQQVAYSELNGEEHTTFSLALNNFSDGGWYWFELISKGEPLEIKKATWSTQAEPTQTGLLSLGITTFNKPEYCLATLAAVSRDPEVVGMISQCLIIDQGTNLVSDRPEIAMVRDALGSKLRIIEQPNLGGSGGFSRVMHESIQSDESVFTMLLDDDVEVEPESVLRAYRFASFNREPTIVGGHMFDLFAKTVIHAWAEIVRPDVFMWGPSFKEQSRHDFNKRNLRQTPWMHARLDADYNGWWMCLIPNSVIREIGYSLPVFIKWDDAEYSLRAREHGVRTVSMPGVAVWHISWLDKDDSQDWQVFFHTRNRIIAALLHGNAQTPNRLLQNSSRQDVKKLLNMQYYPSLLAIRGLKSVLAGPHALQKSLPTDMGEARTLATHFSETTVHNSPETLPPSRKGRVLPRVKNLRRGYPTGFNLYSFAFRWVPIHWFRKSASHDEFPEIEYPKSEALWWVVVKHRSYIAGTADGAGKMLYKHDRSRFRSQIIESRRLHRELRRKWPELSSTYRNSLEEMTSPTAWIKNFGQPE